MARDEHHRDREVVTSDGAPLMPPMKPDVKMSTGIVRGRWENGVAAYRGVPFAAPPVGPRRFAAPQPAEPWQGVRDAGRFGPPPPQPGRATESDDWLNLAVWTPDPGRANLPVVVWISGGGYLNCDSADPYLTGAAVAEAGAVMVSANYRSGFEGFGHIDGAPDNRRSARSGRRAALGAGQHRTFWRRSKQRHCARPVRWGRLDRCPAHDAGSGRNLSSRDPAKHPGYLLHDQPRSRRLDGDLRDSAVLPMWPISPTLRRTSWSPPRASSPIVFCSASTDGARWRTPQRLSLLWSTVTFLPRRRGLRLPTARPGGSSC